MIYGYIRVSSGNWVILPPIEQSTKHKIETDFKGQH